MDDRIHRINENLQVCKGILYWCLISYYDVRYLSLEVKYKFHPMQTLLHRFPLNTMLLSTDHCERDMK